MREEWELVEKREPVVKIYYAKNLFSGKEKRERISNAMAEMFMKEKRKYKNLKSKKIILIIIKHFKIQKDWVNESVINWWVWKLFINLLCLETMSQLDISQYQMIFLALGVYYTFLSVDGKWVPMDTTKQLRLLLNYWFFSRNLGKGVIVTDNTCITPRTWRCKAGEKLELFLLSSVHGRERYFRQCKTKKGKHNPSYKSCPLQGCSAYIIYW